MTAPTPPHLISALEDLDEEAPARRQVGQRFAVHLEGSGVPLEVRTTNRDIIAWERTKARHKEWPTAADAPTFATTFAIWNAAKRAGQTALGFDEFADAVEDIDLIGEEP